MPAPPACDCRRVHSCGGLKLGGGGRTGWSPQVGEALRMHYPTLLQRGCDMLVAYSRFHKAVLPPEDPQFVEQV
eukprot:1733192-Pyramimonas_sp.AAC.1